MLMEGRTKAMILYAGLFALTCFFLFLIFSYVVLRRDLVSTNWDWFSNHVLTQDITVKMPVGGSVTLNIGRSDRRIAWKIYNHLQSRLLAVEFNESYDSIYLTNRSLFEAFKIIREEISNIPLEKLNRERGDATAKFYLEILNRGIRPYLSKWHDPISRWIAECEKNDPSKTYVQMESKFLQRKELLTDLAQMNERMKGYAQRLLLIAKGESEN